MRVKTCFLISREPNSEYLLLRDGFMSLFARLENVERKEIKKSFALLSYVYLL